MGINVMKSNIKLRENESGMVAIVVTVFFMLVLSLIVLSFSQASRREQRQALDQQLSSQAFYAAESGVNDTIKYIRDNLATLPEEKTACDNSGFASFPSGNLGDGGNAAYSCILFDKAPESIELGNLGTEDGEFRSIDTTQSGAQPLKSITLTWHDTDGGSDFTGCESVANIAVLPVSSSYGACDAGILRVVIMPVRPDALTRSGLSEKTFTVFLRPSRNAPSGAPAGSGPTVTYVARGGGGEDANARSQGQVIPAYCTAGECKASIDVSAALGGPSGSLYALFRSVYKPNKVIITGKTVSNSDARFNRAQIMIDSTGRAGDVLRRIQVRVPLYQQYQLPSGFTVDASGGVCKRLSAYPGFASDTECGTGYSGTSGAPSP